MFRNNYDNDSVTFSPQGRIFQVEYASEAVKQGSVVVGLVSKTDAVLEALERNAEELSSYQKKVIAIDSHFGLGLAGLASDARLLSNFLKSQSLSSRLTYGRTNTQHYGKRPYGVGLIVVGVDETGPHLFEFQPSGLTQEMVACAIGARSQMARTYLERNADEFADASREELVSHGLKALKESLAQDKDLTVENTSIGIVGIAPKGSQDIEPFKLYDGQEVKVWIEAAAEGKDDEAEAEAPTETMDVDDA
ncbi:20S proteasome subunit alpha 6 [Pseudogymnoascus sp. 24MN13]|nr:20S proteasome subunit alpha 6 [Pseudogymnoascus sp. 24MN13]